MRGRLLVLTIAMCLSGVSNASNQKNDAADACKQVKEKIRVVQSRMRSGYTRAQGEKLETQLRKLRAKRKKFCA